MLNLPSSLVSLARGEVEGFLRRNGGHLSQPVSLFELYENGLWMVGQLADMDKPSVTDAADLEQYKKVIAPYVEKLTAAYYEFMPKWSNPSSDMSAKYLEVVVFHIKYGKGDDFPERRREGS